MCDPLDSLAEPLRARLEAMDATYDDLLRRMSEPEAVADHRMLRDLSIQRSAIEPAVLAYRRVRALSEQIRELEDLAASGDDPDLCQLAQEERSALQAEAEATVRDLCAHLVQSEDRRVAAVILELRAGTGGDEAGLWCRDLLRMYERYAARRGWAFEPMDVAQDEGLGGVRSAIVSVSGEGVWSELRFEAGVHSVKRVPATESQGRIHTSTATVAVLPEPEEVEVRIDWEKDVEEHVTTSQGPGGQNVNKVATAVQLHHIPTGIVVRMQETKSQHQNRERARRVLLARLHDLQRAERERERAAARRGQIGAAARSEKIRTYRYQEGIVVDQRVEGRFPLEKILEGDLEALIRALSEQDTARRLAEL